MLSNKETNAVKALLLSPDSNNILLATTLLQEQKKAVQQLLIPLDIALTYSEHQSSIVQLLEKHLPPTAWHKLPLYAFYNTIAEPNAPTTTEQQEAISTFIRQEPLYRPYLLADNEKAILYVDGAIAMSTETGFTSTAYSFYQLALEHLPATHYLFFNYADFLRQHPPKGTMDANLQATIIQYYKKAYALKKEKYILSSLANFYADDLNDRSNAQKVWEWCLQEHPKYPCAWISLANLAIKQRVWNTAKQHLEKVLELHKNGTFVELEQVYYLLGKISWESQRQFSEASAYFERALEENQYFTPPLEYLLEISIANKNYPQAIRWHRVALELQPANIFLLLKLAELYTQTKNYLQATKYYKEILSLCPTYTPALEGLAQLEKRL